MSVTPATKWVLILTLGIGFGLAAAFVVMRIQQNSIDGYYEVVDTMRETMKDEATAIAFVRVTAYDSARIVRAAEEITDNVMQDTGMTTNRRRTVLYYFYTEQDTAALTDIMIDELAYSHPEITDPARVLVQVPGGYVFRASFSPGIVRAAQFTCVRSAYYRPRAGVKARNVR